jgi:hypothetical protein
VAAEQPTAREEHQADALLRAELRSTQISVLRRRAAATGVSQDEIDTADDADSPKPALIDLIMLNEAPSVGGAVAEIPLSKQPPAKLEWLRAELTELKMPALRKRATMEGILGEEAVEEVYDSENPKSALIDLLLQAHASPSVEVAEAAVDEDDAIQAMGELEQLRSELVLMRLSVLKKRALSVGMASEAVEAVDDADDPKEAIVALLVETRKLAAAETATVDMSRELEQLRSELVLMKLSVLKKRALSAGMASEAVEAVDDADDPKEAIVALLVEVQAKARSSSPPRPHFGAPADHAPMGKPPQQAEPANLVPKGKHVMLSYQVGAHPRLCCSLSRGTHATTFKFSTPELISEPR